MKMILLAATPLLFAGNLHAAQPAPAKQEKAEPAKVTPVPGLGIANLETVITGSAAFKLSQQQRAVTFKAQLDQATTRRQQLATQLQAMMDKLNKDRAAAQMAPAVFQQRSNEIKEAQNAGNQELMTIIKPVALSDAFVREQISAKLPETLAAVMTKRGISVLIGPNDVLMSTAANSLDKDIIAQLDTVLPSVPLIPPADWTPKNGNAPKGN